MQSQQEVNVAVAVRVRPLLAREKVASDSNCIKVYGDEGQVVIGSNYGFTYDYAFNADAKQSEFYQTCVKSLIDSCFEGYNATVLAYGQTSSGKTYTIGEGLETMETTKLTFELSEIEGVLPRAIFQIFEMIDGGKENVEYSLKTSYIEIYRDELRDLLSPQTSSKELAIRETSANCTVVYGITQTTCYTVADAISCLQKGSAIRQTASTQMNEHSSRSHAIFSILIEQRWDDNYMCSTLNFVDLAGSERAHKTANIGDRFKESVYINTGLLALGNVISALGDPKRRATHVPYRDSKITRLLKDSLGGNARTLMICCVSPASSNFDESLNTLKYANRARNIRNKPIVNRDPQSLQLEMMKTEIRALRQQLERTQTTAGDGEMRSLEDKIAQLQKECSTYRALSDSAYDQLLEIHRRQFLSSSLSTNLRSWMALINEVRDDGDGSSHVSESVLNTELERCKTALEKDEQFFAEKEKELEILKKRIEELETEKQILAEQLDEKESKTKAAEELLLENEIRLTEMEKQAQQNRGESARSVTAPEVAPFRPTSVPVGVLSDQNLDIPPASRQIHSSPALFSLERVMQCFRARSQLLIYKLEDDDQVLSPKPLTSRVSARSAGARKLAMRSDTYKVTASERRPTVEKKEPSSDENYFSDDSDNTVTDHPLSSNLTEKISELETNVRLKEQLIRDLVKSSKQADENLGLLSERLDSVEREKQTVLEELSRVNKALELQRTTSGGPRRDTESRGNSTALSQLKQQYESLQKKLKDQTDRKMSLENELSKEQQKSAALQQKAEKQQKVLKSKNEELVVTQRRLRSAGGNAELSKLEEGKKYLDEQVEAILCEKEQMRILEKELRQREELLRKKESFLEERSRLELKRARASQVLNQSLADMNTEMQGINNDLLQKQSQIENEQTSEDNLHKLESERVELRQRRDSLNRKIQEGVILSEQEERRITELDEAIETLDEALVYKNDIIHSRQLQVRQSHVLMNQSQDDAFGRLSGCSAGELRVLLATFLDKVVKLKEVNRSEKLKCSQLDVELDEQRRLVGSMQVAMQKVSAEAQKQVESVAPKIKVSDELEKQNQQLTKNVSILEKELYYYKKTSRDLRRKVKELSSSAASSASSNTQPQVTMAADPSLEITGKAAIVTSSPKKSESRVKSAPKSRNQLTANLRKKEEKAEATRAKSAPSVETSHGSTKKSPAFSGTSTITLVSRQDNEGSPWSDGKNGETSNHISTPVKVSRQELRELSGDHMSVKKSTISTFRDSLEPD